MNKVKLLLLIFTGLIIFSCQSRFDLKSDKHLIDVFSDNELKEIEKMIHYVDDRVIEMTGNKDIDQAYHQFLDKLLQPIHGDSTYFAPFVEEEKYKFLESSDTTVFNEFWTFGHVRKAMYQDSIYEDGYNFFRVKRKR